MIQGTDGNLYGTATPFGMPGDHIWLVDKQLILNGKPVNEPYAIHVAAGTDTYRDSFPSGASFERLRPQASECCATTSWMAIW